MSASAQPWIKFYPADWRADPMLRVCSMGARGLWMEMLCLMHEAEPRGSLVVAGKQLTEAQLATLVGASRKLITSLIFELEQALVFSRDDDGTIFSRRMRRDVERAERDKANGRKGGNPNLKMGVNPPVNGGDKAQNPEPRTQRSSLREDARGARDAFDREFWPRYPHKVGKPAAAKAFEKVWRDDRGDIGPIIAGLERYILEKATDRPDRPWLNPATFLNQRRFDDEPAPSTSAPPAQSSSPKVDLGGGVSWPEPTVRAAVIRWRTDPTSWPIDRIGPPPGCTGCRVPDHLIREAA